MDCAVNIIRKPYPGSWQVTAEKDRELKSQGGGTWLMYICNPNTLEAEAGGS